MWETTNYNHRHKQQQQQQHNEPVIQSVSETGAHGTCSGCGARRVM
jgi:hypothetical protein